MPFRLAILVLQPAVLCELYRCMCTLCVTCMFVPHVANTPQDSRFRRGSSRHKGGKGSSRHNTHMPLTNEL
jgi:hypothetical protein